MLATSRQAEEETVTAVVGMAAQETEEVEAARAAVAPKEVVTETGTARSTSRCSSCRKSCSQMFGASRSPQTCEC